MAGITNYTGSSSSSSSASAGAAANLRAILNLRDALLGAAGAGAGAAGAAAGGGAAGAGIGLPLAITPLQFFQDHYAASAFECIRTAPAQFANDAKVLWGELVRLADQSRSGSYLQSTAIAGMQLPSHWRYIPHLGTSLRVHLYTV